MNRKFTSLLSCAALGLGLLATQQVNAQLTWNYATTAVSQSPNDPASVLPVNLNGTYGVPDFANASDSDLSTYATLTADRTTVLANTSFVEIGFGSGLPVNTEAYVVISSDEDDLLSGLVSGAVGDLVTGLLDNAGFDIAVKSSATTTIGTYNSRTGNSSGSASFDFEIGPEGLLYIKVSSATQSIQNIRVTAVQDGLLGGILSTPEIYFHDAFYLTGTEEPCNPFLTTTFDATGLNATLLQGSGDPVTNPEFAIDRDPTTYSELGYTGLLNLTVAPTFSQDIIFRSLSNPGDDAAISFEVPSSLLTASLLSNIVVNVFNGSTLVTSETFNSLLSADILTLIQLNIGDIPQIATVDIAPGEQFDRIQIVSTQLLGTNINTPLHIYEAYSVPNVPVLANAVEETCENLPVDLTVTNAETGVDYTWYDTDFNEVFTGATFTTTSPANGSSDTFLVTSSRCPNQISTPTMVVVSSAGTFCLPSDVAGTVDETDYEGSTPLYAVLVDDNNNVIETTPVDPTTGAYSFDETDRGTYSVYILDSNPAIGSTVTAHDVPYGYVVSPTPITIVIDGSGNPSPGNDYSVVWNGPDLVASANATLTSLVDGQSTIITYSITNFGGMPTDGPVTVLISMPSIVGTGTFTLGTLPAGWSLSATTSSAYVLEISTAIQSGIGNAVSIDATYTTANTPVIFDLPVNAWGGSERDATNNKSSIVIQANQ